MSKIPDKLFYKIGEVCRVTDTQPYVLRFWESEFPQLAPEKNRSGQRVYRRADIDLIFRIKKLLYDEEYTIAGARKRLEQEGSPAGAAAPAEGTKAKAPAPKRTRTSGGRTARTVTALREKVAALEEEVAELRGRLEEAARRLEESRARNQELEARAHRAADRLERLADGLEEGHGSSS